MCPVRVCNLCVTQTRSVREPTILPFFSKGNAAWRWRSVAALADFRIACRDRVHVHGAWIRVHGGESNLRAWGLHRSGDPRSRLRCKRGVHPIRLVGHR